jgi:chromosome condensin MukBEF MukE localization factor
MFGMDKEQLGRASVVLRALGEEWRELVAGREGFLTDRKRAGLLRQRVVWGEMDCMVRAFFLYFWFFFLSLDWRGKGG